MASEKPLKMMRNAFYFTLKALFDLEIFDLLPWKLAWLEGLISKRLISKFMASQPSTNVAEYLKMWMESDNDI